MYSLIVRLVVLERRNRTIVKLLSTASIHIATTSRLSLQMAKLHKEVPSNSLGALSCPLE